MSTNLSKREQQVMNLLYEKRNLTAGDIQEAMPDAPTNSAVRSILRLLVEKGHAVREQVGFKYVYAPAVPTERAGRSALRDAMKTFFGGSPQKAFVELVDLSKDQMDSDDWERLSALIEAAKKEEP